jgi:nucleotide-binding universal stress UspA family protein
MYATVLVALDGSTNAEKVLPLVEVLLKAGKGKALLVQVLPPGSEGPEAAAQAYLKEVSSKLAKKKIRSESEIVRGDAAVAIVRCAEDRKVDLVAFTSHGQGGLSQWVFGSVAQKILRGCSRTLLVVRSLEASVERVKRVIVPLDGALGSEGTLPHATHLARSTGASIELLHVTAEAGVEADDSKLRKLHQRERLRMETEFDAIQKGQSGITFTRAFEEGDPATRILERVDKEPGAVIAMGSHGRTGFSRWMFGSVSEKVLQAAKCPVLIARNTTS